MSSPSYKYPGRSFITIFPPITQISQWVFGIIKSVILRAFERYAYCSVAIKIEHNQSKYTSSAFNYETEGVKNRKDIFMNDVSSPRKILIVNHTK